MPTSSSSTDDRIVVGRIGRPHGLRGESTLLPESDDPERFVEGAAYTTDGGRELVLAAVQPYRSRGLLVRFEGVASREDAEALRGALLTVHVSELRPLAAGEFRQADLVGLEAVTPGGEPLGTVTAVEFGPQDRLVVTTEEGSEVLVPFVAAIVGDPVEGRLVIDAPGGLFP